MRIITYQIHPHTSLPSQQDWIHSCDVHFDEYHHQIKTSSSTNRSGNSLLGHYNDFMGEKHSEACWAAAAAAAVGSMASDFCWRGHASGLLQLGVCSVTAACLNLFQSRTREKLGGRNKADAGAPLALSHAVLKTPPPCTCSASSSRRLAGVEPLVSERTSLPLIVR